MDPTKSAANESAWTLLRRVSIFADLTEEGLRDLAQRMKPCAFSAQAVIVNQQEAGESMFVVARGKAKAVLYGESGREIILSSFKPGDFFGEMSLLDHQPRSANVIATEDAELYSLDRTSFEQHLARHPRTALAMLAELSRRLRKADEVIGNLALLDVYARVARILRDLSKEQGEQATGGVLIRERPTQQEIASMIGASRETVSRALSDFARRGLLEMSGKRILLRWSFLQQLADEA